MCHLGGLTGLTALADGVDRQLLAEGAGDPAGFAANMAMRDDIATAFLEPSDYRTVNQHIGEATYFNIASKSRSYDNAVWSYEAPKDEAGEIAGYLAFEVQDGVAVEQV